MTPSGHYQAFFAEYTDITTFCLNIRYFTIEIRMKQKILIWLLLPVIKKHVQLYFQLLVDKELIKDV